MGEDFSRFKIKDYEHWGLFLHKGQYPYLGRCYAWAHDPAASGLDHQTRAMRDEMFDVVYPAWKNAISSIWQLDRPNVASLGNEYPHLHWHLIPRTKIMQREFDMLFVNPNPGGNYAPYPKVDLSEALLQRIKDDIGRRL